MIPDHILLYSQINPLSSHDHRGFLWHQIGVGTELHCQFICDEILSQMSLSGPPLRDRSGNTTKEGKEDCNSQRRWRTPEEHDLLSQLSRAHICSQRLKWKILCLHGSGIGPLGLCDGGQFPVLVIHLRVGVDISYIL